MAGAIRRRQRARARAYRWRLAHPRREPWRRQAHNRALYLAGTKPHLFRLLRADPFGHHVSHLSPKYRFYLPQPYREGWATAVRP